MCRPSQHPCVAFVTRALRGPGRGSRGPPGRRRSSPGALQQRHRLRVALQVHRHAGRAALSRSRPSGKRSSPSPYVAKARSRLPSRSWSSPRARKSPSRTRRRRWITRGMAAARSDLGGRAGRRAHLRCGRSRLALRPRRSSVTRVGGRDGEGGERRSSEDCGIQVERLLARRAPSPARRQPPPLHRPVHVHPHVRSTRRPPARCTRRGDNTASGFARVMPADPPHWHPVFGEADDPLRPEQAVGLLVAEEAGLHLDVGAVVVREGLAPVEAVRVGAPRPDLLGRRVLGRGVVDDSRPVHG